MSNFSTTFRGYDKEEVKSYFDKVINEYERLLSAKKAADYEIVKLRKELERFENLESTLNKAIFSAENSAEDIRRVARNEAENYINEAKKNANRIINDALIKAERANNEAERLRRNADSLKRRLRSIIEAQLEVIEEMDHIDIKDEY